MTGAERRKKRKSDLGDRDAETGLAGDHPEEQRGGNRDAEDEAFKGTRVGEDGQAQRHVHGMAHARVLDDAGQRAEHQCTADSGQGSAEV